MKKLVTILALASATAPSFGQGYVNFVNGASTAVNTNAAVNVHGDSTGALGTGLVFNSSRGSYYYALFAQTWAGGATVSSSVSDLLTDGWTFTGAYATNGLAFGRFGGGTSAGTAAGMPIGGNSQYVVAGWSANLGNSWAELLAQLQSGNFVTQSGFFGVSSTGTITGVAGAPPATSSTLFGSSPAISSGFTLYSTSIIPEPTTFALAGLGAAALLVFRRRK